MSQGLLLAYYALDSVCNVCGLEFDYNNNSNKEEEEKEDNEENLNRDDVADVDRFYNNQILGDLFLGFEVKSEDGRWVHPEFKREDTNGGELENGASRREVVMKN